MSGKVLITGGSGFIGTNLTERYDSLGWEVLNLDWKPPRNPEQTRFWRKVDIRDAAALKTAFQEFSPTLLLHMAARTDMDGAHVSEYSANTDGVAAVIEAVRATKSLSRVIFTSTQNVHRLGYLPKDATDYAPNSAYGESKVVGEKLVRERMGDEVSWTFVRPTSIWGPWFDIPYKDFFTAVRNRRYVHPAGRKILRHYGFVRNAVHQIEKVAACADRARVDGKVFYLADYAPTDLQYWAGLISREFGVPAPREVPVPLLRAAALCGDVVKRLGVPRVPLTSTRLNNMLTSVVYDLDALRQLAGESPCSIEEGVIETAEWMKTH